MPQSADHANAVIEQALGLFAAGQRQRADALGLSLLNPEPDAFAHNKVGMYFRRTGRPALAEVHFRKAVALSPSPVARYNLGNALADLSRFSEAVEAYDQAIALDPADPRFHTNRGAALLKLHRFTHAIDSLHAALALNPRHITALVTLADVLSQSGRIDESLERLRLALAIEPDRPAATSNYLFTLHYSHRHTADQIAQAHFDWGRRQAHLAGPLPPAPPTRPAGPLRLGFVSGDFRRHSVAFFFEPLLEGLDRSRCEVFCYCASPLADDTTARLRNLAAHWRDVWPLDDDAAASLIRADRLDALVDLAGHTCGHRLGIFARRAAPLQLTWLGYPDTTGLAAIDFRLTDRACDGSETQPWHSERLAFLAGPNWCYRPPAESPPVPPRPSDVPVTFGCFAQFNKINQPTLDLWAGLLSRVPDSRLLIKSPPMADPAVRQRVVARFAAAGIDPTRLDLLGHSPSLVEHLSAIARADIALDTFPYNGTTLTCESLWMGVPVVSLRGPDHRGRTGHSLLHAVGLGDLAAESPEAYVQTAAALAADAPRLANLRSGLRHALQASSLLDARRFAEGFVQMLEELASPVP